MPLRTPSFANTNIREIRTSLVIARSAAALQRRQSLWRYFNFRVSWMSARQVDQVDLLWEAIRPQINGGPSGRAAKQHHGMLVRALVDGDVHGIRPADPATVIESALIDAGGSRSSVRQPPRAVTPTTPAWPPRNGVQESLVLASESACCCSEQDLNYVQSNDQLCHGRSCTGTGRRGGGRETFVSLMALDRIGRGLKREFNAQKRMRT